MPAGRLFLDVREQRSLAYSAVSRVTELAHGDQPLVVYVGTQTPKTTQAVEGALEDMERMTTQPPEASETESARRFLSDVFAIRMETIGSIANMVAQQNRARAARWILGQRTAAAVRATDAVSAAAAAAQKIFFTPEQGSRRRRRRRRADRAAPRAIRRGHGQGRPRARVPDDAKTIPAEAAP